ncbi:phosphoadenosine phosphosulfate reductase [Allocatelliglobosispora scoriae]|uniref:Adenosine 5'-phosphosulfate reductase n=1 Tax=Allocatelliglobosispora scoriae TaxID=643052 RepID=A0A841BWD3_9ACTN|nr:phosphoadenylyl-sulfate reductase [Allocatelliglobosispora scoriae]MBB5871788.1 phosphoadenosine phosphosulfate reductase [Allocatelliglobosispora scoriae]
MSATTRSVDELVEISIRAGKALEGAPAEEIIGWAAETFGSRFAVTSSMADAVVAHIASRVVPGIEVIFLDTGLHFGETLRVRDTVARTIPVTVISVKPAITVAEQDEQYGPRLYARDPDQCCAIRKVEPLERALAGYEAWGAGLRRDESPTRARTPVVHFEYARNKVKVNPIATWNQDDVDSYIARYDIPVNQLLKQGYGSVGCWPCTRRTEAGEDARAGRWAMFDKTECGLHAA